MSVDIYNQLAAAFIPDAIQRTKKADTKKGYDTTGVGYQYCVNRFNEVLGLNEWGYDYHILKETTGEYRSGNLYIEITVEVNIWVITKDNLRKCVGGHISSNYADALKGAITNAFKKTAAFWGVGRQAYEGSLDDDAVLPEHDTEKNLPQKDAEKKHVNFKFLQTMKEMKKRIGDEIYYEILGNCGYEHANNVMERKDQVAIYEAMNIIAETAKSKEMEVSNEK